MKNHTPAEKIEILDKNEMNKMTHVWKKTTHPCIFMTRYLDIVTHSACNTATHTQFNTTI